MLDFDLSMTTKILFGRDKLDSLGSELKNYPGKVLFAYGENHIRRTGLHQRIVEALVENNIQYVEFGNIHPNPTLGLAEEGIRLCLKHNIDFILAVGGGSVIDCCKGIAAGVQLDCDLWDVYSGKATLEHALPLGAVLTVAATGSETNEGSVLTNERQHIKLLLLNECFGIYIKKVFQDGATRMSTFRRIFRR